MKTTIITLAAIVGLSTAAGAFPLQYSNEQPLPKHHQYQQYHQHPEPHELHEQHLERLNHLKQKMKKQLVESDRLYEKKHPQYYHQSRISSIEKTLKNHNKALKEQNNTLREHIDDLTHWNQQLKERIDDLERLNEQLLFSPKKPRTCGAIGRMPCYKHDYPEPHPFYHQKENSPNESMIEKLPYDNGMMYNEEPKVTNPQYKR